MTALRASLSEANKAKSEGQAFAQTFGSTVQREPPVRTTKSVEALARKKAGAKK